MKKLFTFLFLLMSVSGFSQIHWNKIFSYNEYLGLQADSALVAPGDTLASAPIKSFAIKNNHVYQKLSTGIWSQVDGGGNAVQSLTGSQSIQYGPFNSIPSPGTSGRFYAATDSSRWYFDNGVTWLNLSGSGGVGGAVLSFGTGLIPGTYNGSAPIVIIVDTNFMSTRQWRQKGLDSLGFVISAKTFAGLSDVSISTPVNADHVYYDSVSAKWKNNSWQEYNAAEWGMHPDSTDCRAKLIALIGHIVNTNGAGTIYLPAGKLPYYISDSIPLNHNIHIRGDGASGPLNNFQSGGTTAANRLGPVQYSTRVCFLNGKNGFVLDSAGDGSKSLLQIDGITFQSTIPPGSSNTTSFIVIKGMSQGSFIHNNTFYGGNMAIDKQSGYYTTIAYNHFSAQRKAGMKSANVVRDDTGDDLILGNTFNSGTFTPAAGDTCIGFWWQSGGGQKFVGNKFDAAIFGTSTAYYWQILAENVQDPTSDFIVDASNSFEDWGVSAIKMRGVVSPYVRNIQIFGQYAGVATLGPAIDIDHMSNIGIYGVSIRDWSGLVAAPAIRVTNSTDVTIGKGDIVSGSYTSNFDLTGSTTTHIDYMYGGDMAVGSLNTTNLAGLNSSLYTTETILGRSTSGTNGSGILELADQLPDASGKDVGYLNFSTPTNSVAKRVAIIGAVTSGGTVNNRGGELDFFTNPNGSTLTKQFSIGSSGSLFSNNLNDGTGVAKMVVTTNGILGYQAIPSGGGGSGSPGGSSQNVQVKSGSNFYGNNAFSWDTTNLRLTIGTSTVTYPTDLNISRSVNGPVGFGIQNISTGATARAENYLVESSTQYAGIGRWNSTATANWAGTSIPQAENAYAYTFSGSAAGNKPIVFNGTPVFALPGSTGTNMGFRQDATGLRVGPLSGLHNSNTYTLEVDGGLSTQQIISGTTGFSNITLGAAVPTGGGTSSGNSGGSNQLSGNFFINGGTGSGSGSLICTVTITAQPSANYRVFLQDTYSGTHLDVSAQAISTTQFQLTLQSGSTFPASGSYSWSYLIIN